MSKATQHLAAVSAGLTLTYAADVLRKIGSSEEDATRLNALVGPMVSNMAYTDGMKFLKDTVASTKGKNPDGTEGQPDEIVKKRASEVRQIYAASKLVNGFDWKQHGGYWKTYSAAQAALKAAGIRASGAPILTEQQKADLAISKAQPAIMAELLASDPQLGELTANELAARAQKLAAEKIGGSEVEKHAERIVKTNGVPYAVKLVKALESAIAKAETAAAEKASQPEQKAEPQGEVKQQRKAKKAA